MTKRFAILNVASIVENVVLADDALDPAWIDLTDIDPQPGIGWSYVNGQFSPPPAPPAPPPPPNIITKIAMITRFTDAEFVGVLAATKTDVEVEAWYVRFSAANTINLDAQSTKDGIALLVSKNLLTQTRGEAILTAPVQPEERP